MPNLFDAFAEDQRRTHQQAAKNLLGKLVQPEQYVGEVWSISYEYASVQIHDHHRMKVGGIPSLSFLVATRITPTEEEIDFTQEDTSVVLLRVLDAASLPHSQEAERVRAETARRVSGDTSTHWDHPRAMDAATHDLFSFAGVRCRVLGTFFLEQVVATNGQHTSSQLQLRFGSDLSNYYPNRGLKVYKPNSAALEAIVNYRDLSRMRDLRNKQEVKIGSVRYASTNREYQGIDTVSVSIMPEDLLAQKSALFSMTRTGKSNTAKIIAKSVFELRFDHKVPRRVGQLIFDPNGEYANENAQDNNKALKNIWMTNKKGTNEDVVTYGILEHPNDPHRRLMRFDFFADSNLQLGKDIIDGLLPKEDSKYIKNFQQVVFRSPDAKDSSAMTRYRRQVLAYRSLLAKSGFSYSDKVTRSTTSLFNDELIKALNSHTGEKAAEYKTCARIFSSPNPSWGQLYSAFETLNSFFTTQEYKDFNDWYLNKRPKASGNPWADETFKVILEMIWRPNGPKLIGAAIPQHAPDVDIDYADEIYEHLARGRLVIVDQSSGDPELNDSSARRIMWRIFDGNRTLFRQGKEEDKIPHLLIYIEEAHNLLPSSKEDDLRDIWVRTAKEGAKYHLGMIYITQEVSSVQRNILKNTANWFIGHLNNTDETRELTKFYDFADFEMSIRRAQDRGFLRVKTLSNPYVVPVQVDLFEMPDKAK